MASNHRRRGTNGAMSSDNELTNVEEGTAVPREALRESPPADWKDLRPVDSYHYQNATHGHSTSKVPQK